jgi:GNAT superfamily N-acetyltransferase
LRHLVARLASRRSLPVTGGSAGVRPAAVPEPAGADATAPVLAAEPVCLRDGSSVLVRSVQPTDGALLLDGFARLSLHSRYGRFLTAKRELTPAEVQFLTHLDHHDHDAIGAIDPMTRRGVGVARFVRSKTDPQAAEVAITVVDDWQRRGVGTLLLQRLVERAREVGIFYFTAVVSADNDAMIGLLRNGHSGIELTSMDGAVLEYQISLASFSAKLDAVADADDIVVDAA